MTDVALRDYIDQRLGDFDRRVSDRFMLNDVAIREAKDGINARLAGMNEFRDALKDQTNRMATRLELEKLTGDVEDLRRTKANFEGRMIVIATLASFAMSLIVGIGMWALNHFTR